MAGEFQLSEKEIQFHIAENQKQIEYFEDITGALTLDSVLKKEFHSTSTYNKDTYNSSSVYWFRVKLDILSDKHKLWLFEFMDPHVQEINLWHISSKDTIQFNHTGFNHSFESRSLNHKNFVFPIRFVSTDPTWLYFSFKNNYHFNLSINLRPAEAFINYALTEYYLLGLFYGILLIMAVYNFFIFFTTREKVYIYYVAYVLCYCINAFKEDGIGFQFIWPETPIVNQLFEFSYTLLLIISFVAYSKEFLNLKRYSDSWNKWINISVLFYLIAFLTDYFFVQVPLMQYLYLIPFTLVYSAGVYIWKSGNRSAKYFLVAFSFLILSITVFVLRITGILPTTILTVYALNFGFLLEVVLFSYALGQRLRLQRDEKAKTDALLINQLRENEKLKDSLNKELEIKVEERTKEVKAKNDQLASALNELKEKNLKIEELNLLLVKDNKQLNQDIKDITKARLMLKDLTLEEFQKIYPDENACLKYLSDIKWSKTYSCKKCSNKNSSEGKTPFSKRCTKCGYDESVTSFTIFHNSKLPITKTFYLVYLILANRTISSHELSQKLELRQKTCWAFKKKVIEAAGTKGTGKINSKEWGKIFYTN